MTSLIGFKNNFLASERVYGYFQTAIAHQNWTAKFKVNTCKYILSVSGSNSFQVNTHGIIELLSENAF